jgi:hypothetical protein
MSLPNLSRWQLAITVVFHMTFPAITVGLSIFLAVAYGVYWTRPTRARPRPRRRTVVDQADVMVCTRQVIIHTGERELLRRSWRLAMARRLRVTAMRCS